MIEATKIYARFASEVYDDFGDVDEEQEYYRKEHADEELRKALHALWMARAYNGFNATYNLNSYHNYMIEHPNTKVTQRRWYHCWKTVERMCLEKAKEFEG